MSSSIPKTMKAVTVAVAGNPTDCGHIDYRIGPQDSILGCDAAGQIVKLGLGVDCKRFALGDYISGFIHGSSVRFLNGAFAEYSAVSADTAYRLPNDIGPCGEDSLPEGPVKSLEGAVTFPVSLTTAGMILTYNLGLNMEWKPSVPQRGHPILIWGGATAVTTDSVDKN
ncbi:hypothetical protein GRS66_007911 [Saccharomyces pastorianus]|uniref:Alcohol dehydrogenase-like N-terminal domain-containing protein n=1 Tax=Saccharomyces pastorianus TaxID=27292 RepID=A0A6C1E8Z6_SACPS|nr:hypothetical protein GRS66_007911 [Saccharomyces pastorianus]